MRILWLVVAFLLAVGGPFLAIGTQTVTCAETCTSEPSLGWPAAILVSLIALVIAAWAVRRSTRDRPDS